MAQPLHMPIGALQWLRFGPAVAWAVPAAAAATTTQAAQPASVAGAVYQKVGPSVVEVLVAGPSTRFGRTQSGSGSGIVIDSSGYILTNNHVVAGAASIRVRFSDGQERTAQVVGRSVTAPGTDNMKARMASS